MTFFNYQLTFNMCDEIILATFYIPVLNSLFSYELPYIYIYFFNFVCIRSALTNDINLIHIFIPIVQSVANVFYNYLIYLYLCLFI